MVAGDGNGSVSTQILDNLVKRKIILSAPSYRDSSNNSRDPVIAEDDGIFGSRMESVFRVQNDYNHLYVKF